MANTTHSDEKGNPEGRMREPPEVKVKLRKLRDLLMTSTPWEEIETNFLPVDFLLLTAKDCAQLSCLSFLYDIKRGYTETLGSVYFGFNSRKEPKLKIAVIKCFMGFSGPNGSIVVVQDAVPILRPKAVICVGYCGSLDEKNTKLGDVIVSSKLTIYALARERKDGIEYWGPVVPTNKDMANLMKHAGAGWKAPLTNTDDMEVTLRSDGVFLSGPNVLDEPKHLKELKKRFRRATAIEMEGHGLYEAAHSRGIEWLVIKGVSDLADGSNSGIDSWRPFASVMAASLVFHMLNDTIVFEDWPHYEKPAEDAQPGPSTRGKLRYKRPGEMMPTTSKENTRQDVTTSSITESNLVAREKEKSGSRASSLDWMKNISLVESEECTIDDQGKTWNLTDIEAGACITFTPYALSTPLLFRCKLHNPTTDLPPLNEDETLVSSVIGLTCDEQPDIHFVREGKGEVTIALSHSAPKLEGYEVVIREVVSSESGHEWKDLETTNIWNVSDNQDDSAISMVPYAKAKVTHCGSYATIYRLKSYAYSTTASRRKEVTYRITEYPKVSVTIPARNVKGKSKLDLSFKVQEVPPKWFDCGEEVPGPVLHITCSQITRLLEPATITLPMTLKEDKDESSRFSLNTYVIRVFGSRSDNGKSGWEELTEQLPEPAVLTNGVVTFQVKHFSRYTVCLLKAPRKVDKKLVGRIKRFTRDTPLEAGFLACLCNTVAEKAHLKVYCYPAHLRRNVKKEVFSTHNIDWYGTGDSQEALRPGEKLRVKLWNGCQAKKELILRFRSEDMFENSEEVQLSRRLKPHVKFFQHHQEQPQQKLLCEFSIATPCQSITVDNHRGMSADSSDSEGSSLKRSWLPSGPGRGPDPKRGKRPQGEFYAEDAQPGTSNQGGRRSTRPRDIAPTTSGGESYAEDAQPGPSNRGGQRSTRPRDTAPTTSRVMAGRPSEDELEELSQELGEKWEELAGRLGYNQAARSNFYANDRCSNRLARSAYSMLLAWKQREGSKATYEVLYNALCHKLVQCNLLAQKFCCE